MQLRRLVRPRPLPWRQLWLASRPALWVNTLGVAVTGLWLSGQLWSWDGRWLLLLAYLGYPYNLLIYGLNDLADRAEDALSPRKGGLQGARLRDADVWPVLFAILATNLPLLAALAVLLPPAATLTLLGGALLFAAYSLPPLRLKARPFLDSLSNLAYALPVLLPALVFGRDLPWGALAALALFSVGKHALDAVQDIPTDRAAGVRTVATRLGARGAARWALAWFLGSGACLWALSPLSALSVWGLAGGLALALLHRPSPGTGARLYPLSLLLPWVLGAVAGVQLVYALARGLWP